MIDGVLVTPLKQIEDGRGKVMHMLRSDQNMYRGFGEIYFSSVRFGSIKGWNLHTLMTVNYAVPHGLIKLVLYDNRNKSKTHGLVQDVLIGNRNYCLVTVPPMIWISFKGISKGQALLANCASLAHDPDEKHWRDLSDPMFPLIWG